MMKEIGAVIAEFRKSQGLTQEEFANRIGCTKQSISHYERNLRKPSYEVLENIADEFNINIELFISKEERKAKLDRIYKTYNLQSDQEADIADIEIRELREVLRRRPEMRMLFILSKSASKSDIERTCAIIEALKGVSDNN